MAKFANSKKFSMSVNFRKPFSPSFHEFSNVKAEAGETEKAEGYQKKPPTGKFGVPHFHGGVPHSHGGVPFGIPEEQAAGVPFGIPEEQAAGSPSPPVASLFKHGTRGFKGMNAGSKVGGCIKSRRSSNWRLNRINKNIFESVGFPRNIYDKT